MIVSSELTTGELMSLLTLLHEYSYESHDVFMIFVMMTMSSASKTYRRGY